MKAIRPEDAQYQGVIMLAASHIAGHLVPPAWKAQGPSAYKNGHLEEIAEAAVGIAEGLFLKTRDLRFPTEATREILC